MKTNLIRLVWPILLAVVMVISIAAPAFAVDYQNIISAAAFRHIFETDDMLLVFHADLHYDTVPDTPCNKYYHFRLMDTTGLVELASTVPYVYYNSGFDEMAGAFYFSAADAPLWEDAHIIKISGNPEYHAAPVPEVSYTLTLADYSQLPTQDENRTLLGNYVLEIAHSLQTDWGVEMTVNSEFGEVLTAVSDSYFRGTISGIESMAPQIFAVQTSNPAPTTLHPGTAMADSYSTRYDGTIVGDALEHVEDFFGGTPWNVITGLAVCAGCIVLFIISHRLFATNIPGMVASYVVILAAFLMGFMAVAIFGIVTLLAAMYIAYILFFRTSSG